MIYNIGGIVFIISFLGWFARGEWIDRQHAKMYPDEEW